MTTDRPIVCLEGLVVHPDDRVVLIDGGPVGLTRTEFRLLRFLARHAGRAFTRREIIDGVRGEDYPASDRTIDVQVNGLRKKLRQYGNWIETVRGTGYRFQPETPTGQTGPSPSAIPDLRQSQRE